MNSDPIFDSGIRTRNHFERRWKGYALVVGVLSASLPLFRWIMPPIYRMATDDLRNPVRARQVEVDSLRHELQDLNLELDVLGDYIMADDEHSGDRARLRYEAVHAHNHEGE